MLKYYYTIKNEGSYEKNIQKSRFIGYINRVNGESEAQEFINSIKKKHHDATHNCSAYLIGDHDQVQKANDDGEPSGTAGVPMLEVLKKLNLKNVVIVITRYFGGIKLGAGGLIRAYSTTTSETIKHVGIVKRELMQGFSIKITYPLLGKIENALQNSPYLINQINYAENVELIIYAPSTQQAEFIKKITELTNGQLTIDSLANTYVEVPVTH